MDNSQKCCDCQAKIDKRSLRCRSCRTKQLLREGRILVIVPPVARFWDRVIKTNSCWIWKGLKDKNGYGRLGIGRKYVRSHRFSYEIHKGKIAENMLVLHQCDNPSCVNPDHLTTGTHRDNQREKSIRGRINGKRNPNYKHGNRIKK